MVIVGADRVSKHGDVANKIAPYLKALAAAHDNDVPFYAALPISTIDFRLTMRWPTLKSRSAAPMKCETSPAARRNETRDWERPPGRQWPKHRAST